MKKEIYSEDSRTANNVVVKILRRVVMRGYSNLTIWDLSQVYMRAKGKMDGFVRELWNAEQSGYVLIQDGRVYLSNAGDICCAPAGNAATN